MKIVFLGPPGAGKGTQAVRVCDALGIPQISTGDLLRTAMREGTETGKQAKAYIDAGQLVPDALVIALLAGRIAQADCVGGYILDGFPRTVPQAQALEDIATLDAVVNLDIDDEALIARLSGRRVCPACGATYHLTRLAGREDCEKCSANLIRRTDDDPETVLSRLAVYHRQTEPLIEYYAQKGLLKTVDGALPLEEGFEAVMQVLGVRA